MRKLITAILTAFFLLTNVAYAGSTGSEKLKKSPSSSANECFEGVSRAMFSFNQAIDATVFEPIAKGYRILPMVIRNGSSNMMSNISNLLTIPNNILQVDFTGAGNTVARLAINTTVGILGFFDPAEKMGFPQAQHVDMDSTGQEPGLTYPSDAKLMTQLVERCLKVTNWVKRKTKSIVPKDFFVNLKEVKSKAKGYFFLAKNATKDAKQKCFAEIHRVAKREIYNCLDIFSQLGSKKIEEMPWNIRRSYDQIASQAKRYMLDVAHFIRTGSIKPGKTLSFHLNDVACIVKNKVGKPYEFGRVFQVGRLKGNFVWSAPHTTVRMDDKSALPPLLEVHERLFDGIEIESCATDKSYYSLVNEQAVLEALSTTGIMHLGYQYEDVNDDLDSQLKDHRAGIEAIIGHIKSGGQLGKSRMKSDEGNLSAGYAAMGGFNLRQLMRYLVKS